MLPYSTTGPKRDGPRDHELHAGWYFVNCVPGARRGFRRNGPSRKRRLSANDFRLIVSGAGQLVPGAGAMMVPEGSRLTKK